METANSAVLVERGNIRLRQTRHGLMLYNIHDSVVGRSLDLYGDFAYEKTKLFAQALRPGMSVLDLGAHIGAHTLYFAQAVGPTGGVLAVEPQRLLYHMLCANLALNEISNVRPAQMGVGREEGRAFVPPIDYSREQNFGAVALARSGGGEQIMVKPIDGLGLPAVHFMKVDVEGMEEEVIAGAAETIRKFRPVLYVENERPEKSPALIRRLLELDYALYWHAPALFSPENFYQNPTNVFPNMFSRSLLCLPPERGHDIEGFRKVDDPYEWPWGL